jgi:hypothetical protein
MGPVNLDTLRWRVINFLVLCPVPCTATQLQKSLTSPTKPIKLSSLSSLLKKMYDAGELRRVDDWGPRGGYGYQVNHS